MAAVTSPEGVCNLALGLLGHRQFLDSMAEATTEAQVCRVFYRPTVVQLLSLADWSFARKTQALALTTETRPGWAYAYRQPSDCVEPRYLDVGNPRPGRDESPPFARALSDAGDGALLLCNVEDAVLAYTADVETVALYPAPFVHAVAAHLAVAIAGALAVKPQLLPMLEQAARLRTQQALAVDGNAQRLPEEAAAESISERG